MSGIATPAPTWKYSQGRLTEGSLLMASMHASVAGIAASATPAFPVPRRRRCSSAARRPAPTGCRTCWVPGTAPSPCPTTLSTGAACRASGGGEGGKGGGMHLLGDHADATPRRGSGWSRRRPTRCSPGPASPCTSGTPPGQHLLMHPTAAGAVRTHTSPTGRGSRKPPTPSPLLFESSSFALWAATSVSARARADVGDLTSYDGARPITGHSGGGGGEVGGEGSGGGGEGGGEGEGGGGCTHAEAFAVVGTVPRRPTESQGSGVQVLSPSCTPARR